MLADRRPRLQLFLLSFLMLFLELSLIRWLGENVLYLSYFTNFVLLASFLGIGVGFLVAGRKTDLFRWLPYALLGLIGLLVVFPIRVDRSVEEVLFLGSGDPSGLPIWLALPLVFLAVAGILAMVGQETGRAFGRFEPLIAYRLDILGSLSGVIAFAALSLAGVPPLGWSVVVAALVLYLRRGRIEARFVIALLGIVIVLGAQTLRPGSTWSPYYRIDVVDESHLYVNGIPHQVMLPVERQKQPVSFLESDLGWLTTWPYEVIGDDLILRDVLVVGAGSGNDVAYALSRGALHIDAVEIDPRIRDLGRDLHLDEPYGSPRVNSIINDARAFMENAESRYDLVIFALPDSLTLVAGQSNLRLESYLYTIEAFEAAGHLLAEGGVFAIYNTHPDNFVVDRMARTMAEVFGGDVCGVGTGDDRAGTALVVGQSTTPGCAGGESVDVAGAPPPATDDRPFVYVQSSGIPAIYAIALFAILATSLLVVRGAGVSLRRLRPHTDLFLMGAAFLLLETKSIVQFALWFGTTWSVNALVFAAVLVTVLAAIEVARRVSTPRWVLYPALMTSLGVAWLVPPEALLTLGPAWRWVSASLLTFLPVFIANLVFAVRFKETSSSTNAFGANLLGAMVGGMLEYTALALGYRSLIVVTAVLYAAAFAALRFSRSEPALA